MMIQRISNAAFISRIIMSPKAASIISSPVSSSSSAAVFSSSTSSRMSYSSSSSNDNKDSSSSSSSSLCSPRGRIVPSLLPTYLSDARSITPYHPVLSPNGVLSLSVAENKMMEDMICPFINRHTGLFSADRIYYQPTCGGGMLVSLMCGYLKRLLALPTDMDMEGVVVGAGCNAVLENLAFVLSSAGEAVLIPVPYYAAFEFDLVARAGLSVVPVTTTTSPRAVNVDDDDDGLHDIASRYYPGREALDRAYEHAMAQGSRPRILLLCHPNNPLGVCYPPHVVKECIDWARERQVHLISDEIYAGSVYQPITGTGTGTGEDRVPTFTSALRLAAANTTNHDTDTNATAKNNNKQGLGLGDYIHFVYAMSKDFALSGLRVGVCYTENKSIRLPLKKLNDFCQVSSQTQMLVEQMLKDEKQLFSFLDDTQTRVRQRCDDLRNLLDRCKVRYLVPTAGLFLWLDFSEFLPPLDTNCDAAAANDHDHDDRQLMELRERTLYLELLHDYGLLFTPGMSMRNERPGYFRCVFTSATQEEFDLALKRIETFVQAKRQQMIN